MNRKKFRVKPRAKPQDGENPKERIFIYLITEREREIQRKICSLYIFQKNWNFHFCSEIFTFVLSYALYRFYHTDCTESIRTVWTDSYNCTNFVRLYGQIRTTVQISVQYLFWAEKNFLLVFPSFSNSKENAVFTSKNVQICPCCHATIFNDIFCSFLGICALSWLLFLDLSALSLRLQNPSLTMLSYFLASLFLSLLFSHLYLCTVP